LISSTIVPRECIAAQKNSRFCDSTRLFIRAKKRLLLHQKKGQLRNKPAVALKTSQR
jgi:hypothetical protein